MLTAATICLAMLGSMPTAAHGLEPRARPRAYGAELFRERHGLPSNSIRALAQTRDGQIWVASVGGVARYDGTGFTEVKLPLEAAPSAQVTQLLGARDGSLWITPQFRLPIRALGHGFDDVLAYPGLPREMRVSAWAERPNGDLVVATKEGFWTLAGRRIAPFAIPGIADSGEVTALAFGAGGEIWVGTKHGVRLASAAGTRPVSGDAGTQRTEVLLIDRRGVAFAVAERHLHRLDAGGTSVSVGGPLPGAAVCLTDDRDGNLWIGGSWGLATLHEGELQLSPPIHGVSAPDVTALLEDHEGSLWVGMRDAGLMRLTDRTLEVTALPAAYRSAVLEALCEDDEGALWIVPERGGIARYDGTALKTFGSADGLPSNDVWTCTGAAGGGVWIGTDGGLARWRAGKVTQEKGWTGKVTALSRGRQGALWIAGTSRIGRLVDGALTVFDGGSIQMDDIRVLTEDAAGVVWIATGTRGLFRLQDGHFAPLAIGEARGEEPVAKGVLGLQVRSIYAPANGDVLLATSGRGLLRVSGTAIASLGTKNGLPTNVLYQMLEDDDGALWIGTHRGLVRIPRAAINRADADGMIESAVFDCTDFDGGVVAARRRQGSALKRRDGSLWFVVERGAVRVDPRRARINTAVPAIVIEGVTVNGQEQAPREGLVLAPNVARLELRFAALSFQAPERNHYRFLLEGLNRAWSDAGTRPSAEYTHLGPGTYRFRVQAANNDGVWNTAGASLGFVIQPTYYQTAWFGWACALAMLGLVLLAYRLRLRAVRARDVAVIAERTRMARDLHDTLLQGLSAVTLQLEAARRLVPSSTSPLAGALDIAQATATRGLHEARSAVWDLRSVNAPRDELALSIERLSWRLDQTFGGTGRVHVHTQRERGGTVPRLPSHASTELYRIAQEAITNALRHGDPKRVDVALAYASDYVRLTVRDNGCGFETTADPAVGHFGLRGMRERAAALGGTLVTRSRLGRGTTIELTLPLELRRPAE